MPPVATPPASSGDASAPAVEPAPCPECRRPDCADEVEAYLHQAARSTRTGFREPRDDRRG